MSYFSALPRMQTSQAPAYCYKLRNLSFWFYMIPTDKSTGDLTIKISIPIILSANGIKCFNRWTSSLDPKVPFLTSDKMSSEWVLKKSNVLSMYNNFTSSHKKSKACHEITACYWNYMPIVWFSIYDFLSIIKLHKLI